MRLACPPFYQMLVQGDYYPLHTQKITRQSLRCLHLLFYPCFVLTSDSWSSGIFFKPFACENNAQHLAGETSNQTSRRKGLNAD